MAEVDVDIGHGDALGIEEALEEQDVLEGIDVGDLHGIGDEGAGGGAAAGADGDAVVAGVLDEVPDDEEVAGVLHLLDDADFEVQAGFVVVRLGCAGLPRSSSWRTAVSRRLRRPARQTSSK